MQTKWTGKIALILLILVFIIAFKWFGLGQYFSWEYLKTHHEQIQSYYVDNSALFACLFMLIYIAMTALSLPGAAILTLEAGAIFGLGIGVLIVSFSSTIGATLAFLISRYLLRDFVRNKFKEKLSHIMQGVEKDGAFYLFTLRLIPIFPFFLINTIMGLTPIRITIFFFVSQLGMLPGIAVFVNAGTQLAHMKSPDEILSFEVLISFALIGILPLLAKWILSFIKSRMYFGKYSKPNHFDYRTK